MNIYDINGNIITGDSNVSVSEAEVRSAIINGIQTGEIELPVFNSSGTLSLEGIANYTDWLDGVKTAFDSMMIDYKKNEVDGIPLFLATDLHGIGYEVARIPNNYDSTVFSIVLGDLCGDYFNTGQIASIKNAHKPIANIVSVAGNHDVVVKEASDERTSYYAINDSFKCTESKKPNNKLYQVVYDELHGCKYVVVSGYHLNGSGYGMGTSYTNKVSTEEMKWLIDELSRDDGYDIIVLSHEPLGNKYTSRDGTTEDITGYDYYSGLRKVLRDRKAYSSGTVTDGDGVSHTYDFTKSKTKCLCSFHGHLHEELYSTNDGWVEYCERAYSTNVTGCVSWALIDRNAMTLTIYKAGSNNLVIEL